MLNGKHVRKKQVASQMPMQRDLGFLVAGCKSSVQGRFEVSLPWRLFFCLYKFRFICFLNEASELTKLSFGPLFFTKGAGT